jgi:hypothetical protein
VAVVGPITYEAGMIVNFQGLNLVTLLTVVWVVGNNPSSQLKFLDEFMFAAATSVYQIEGAWNDTGKFQFKYLNLRHLLQQSTVKPTEITDYICH